MKRRGVRERERQTETDTDIETDNWLFQNSAAWLEKKKVRYYQGR